MNIDQLNWDDVRVFLATMRASSLRQAAQDLGVSRPTAGRHLSALEERLGLPLFDRRPDGLHATPEAIELAAAAKEVERAMRALGRVAQGANPDVRGDVRVSMPEVAASDLLMPDLIAFCERWPQIELHIDGSYGVSSLADRETDVAIRFMPAGKAPQEDLTGRKAGTAWIAAYGFGDCWIGQRGAKVDAQWVRESDFPDLPIRGSIMGGAMQRAACAGGLGLAMLPCFMAEPLLTRRSEPIPGFDIWVLVHPDLRRNPRLRVFRDAMVEAIKGHRNRLEGRAAG